MAMTNQLTAADLARIDEPGYRHELIEGALQRMPPAGGEHGEIGMEIGWRVMNHVKAHRLGRVYGPDTGFLLATDPDTVLAPDIAVVRADRLPPRSERMGFLRVVPDLVIEIISPSERAVEVEAKIERYLAFGVPLVWTLIPRELRVMVHETGRTPRTLESIDHLDGGDILPGFSVRVAELFA